MNIQVLYSISEDYSFVSGQESQDSDLLNALELNIPLFESREILLGDLLLFIKSDPNLDKSLGTNYNYYAKVDKKWQLLLSPASVLPVQVNNELILRLVPSPSPPFSQLHLLDIDLHSSRLELYDEVGKYSASNRKSKMSAFVGKGFSNKAINSNSTSYPKSDSKSAGSNLSKFDEAPQRTINSEQPNIAGLQSFVGEETAAVITDAAEVAKGAATAAVKSIFSWGKSIIDVASNVAATSTLPLPGSNTGSLSVGSTVSVGYSKVQVSRLLSEGGFGLVYLVRDSSTQQQLALKQLLCQSRDQIEEAHNEVDALLALKGHPNIIELLDHCSVSISSGQARQVLLLFPLYSRGTAFDAIERATPSVNAADDRSGGARSSSTPWPFPEKIALYIIEGIAQALDFMHQRGFSHRDVKPHNILLSDPSNDAEERRGVGKPVLMDFGSMSSARVELNSRQDALRLEDEAAAKTSMAYRAPELFQAPYPPYTIDERVDTWALGCSLYCLAFGRSPFESPKEGVQRLGVLNGKFTYPAGNRNMSNISYSEGFVALINAMLQQDIQTRPFMSDVIETCHQLLNSR